jgi:hypothetical protein
LIEMGMALLTTLNFLLLSIPSKILQKISSFFHAIFNIVLRLM